MSVPSDPEGPRWRSGPFIYGAVIISLPLIFGIVWALPTIASPVMRGDFSGVHVALWAAWGVVVITSPAIALAYRRQYQYSDEWHRPRRISILFAGLTYVVSILSYVGLVLMFVGPNR